MQAIDRALLCAAQIAEKKAYHLRILDVRRVSSLTDFLVLATGSSDRQVQAAAEAVRVGLKQQHDVRPLGVEGMNEGRWVLIDYGDVMVHVFQEPVRQFYDLDGLWRDAVEVPLPPELAMAAQAGR